MRTQSELHKGADFSEEKIIIYKPAACNNNNNKRTQNMLLHCRGKAVLFCLALILLC